MVDHYPEGEPRRHNPPQQQWPVSPHPARPPAFSQPAPPMRSGRPPLPDDRKRRQGTLALLFVSFIVVAIAFIYGVVWLASSNEGPDEEAYLASVGSTLEGPDWQKLNVGWAVCWNHAATNDLHKYPINADYTSDAEEYLVEGDALKYLCPELA